MQEKQLRHKGMHSVLLMALIRKSPQASHQSASLYWNQKEKDIKLFPLLEKAAFTVKKK